MSVLSTIAKALAGRAAKQGGERAVARRAAPLAVERRAAPLVVRRSEPLAVKGGAWWDAPAQRALPAPPKPLALPAPGPGLPPHAAKPRGGQWWVDKEVPLGDYSGNFSPEHAARAQLPTGVRFSSGPTDVALRDWWDKALPRYLKNDFATADDPLRALADRGLLPPNAVHPQIDADTWSRMAGSSFSEDPIEHIMFPRNEMGGMPGAGDDLRGGALSSMPWLAKQPVTDNIYQMRPRDIEDLNFTHVGDELRNALSPEVHGFPPDLAVRPESLQRMSFPQAVEHVGKIGQWREAQMAKQQAEAMNNPAIQTFKEYPDDPRGMRWVELRQPEYDPTVNAEDYYLEHGRYPEEAAPGATHLQDALRFEGDTMGHCVGGYCDDVVAGRSRIFSLRDSKGQPHVTIETGPPHTGNNPTGLRYELPDDVRDTVWDEAMTALKDRGDPAIFDSEGNMTPFGNAEHAREQDLAADRWLKQNAPHDIVQIKGKQNRAPNDDYLPYVQDFVKSGQWGRVGDLRNTGLTRLPDGRYITDQQWDEGMRKALQAGNPSSDPAVIETLLGSHRPNAGATFSDEDWKVVLPHFEGFAYGGRVEADRDFARRPMAVTRRAA